MNYFPFRSLAFSLVIFCLFSMAAAQQNNKQPEKTLSPGIEQAILDEINEVRADPQKFISYLEDYKKIFKGKTAYYADGRMIVTIEGTLVIDEAIGFLKTLPKLAPYNLSKGLSIAANPQLSDLMENSSLGHFGKDGSNLTQRLARFGSYENLTAENITYFAPLPREIVMTMIIDDGVKGRGHRKNIFSANLKQIGSAFGQSKKGENLCVIIFADSFKEAGPIPIDKRLKPF